MIGIDARSVRPDGLKLRRLERFVYEYDFGDSWIHDLRLEATLPINPRKIYPMCVAGKCSAPPEDCGGPSAFHGEPAVLRHRVVLVSASEWLHHASRHQPHLVA
jgi:hypothetical protein